MSNSSLILELRKKALETLQESNRMFDGASLLQEASVKEAEQMQVLARAKRADAAWLMAEADRLEQESIASAVAKPRKRKRPPQ